MRSFVLRTSSWLADMLLLVLTWGSVPVAAAASTEAPCYVHKPASGCVKVGEAPPTTLHVYTNLERSRFFVVLSDCDEGRCIEVR